MLFFFIPVFSDMWLNFCFPDKPFAIKEDKDEFFMDPSVQPEVPDKNFENPYEDTVAENSDEKKCEWTRSVCMW